MKLPRVKVCGITREKDARVAVSLGATCLGFILYPKSPRAITLAHFQVLKQSLPDSFRVAVDVRPSLDSIKEQMDAGFDYFQVHFSEIHDDVYLSGLSQAVGPERLWLAPKLPPESLFPESLFQYADSFLIDTYSKDVYGGSGHTGDWPLFRRLKEDYPEKHWILAGGLSPDNIRQAVEESEADTIDVNSGVEESPGLKDPEKLKSLFEKLRT